MPSSGLPSINLFAALADGDPPKTDAENHWLNLETTLAARYIEGCAKHAMKTGLFIEWLECFVGAFNETKDPYAAAAAGIVEWDM